MAAAPLRLLLVEDNPGDARLVHEALRDAARASPFAIHHVERLDAGLAYLATHDVDIVLLDLGLPDSQGLDSVHRVVAAAPGIAVVVLTGQDDEEMGLAALQAGAEDYLTKGLIAVGILPKAIRYAVERNMARTALRQSNRALNAVRNVNRIIVRERDPARLIDQACHALVRSEAFACSWLLLTDERREITHATSAGFDDREDPAGLWRQGGMPGCLAAMDPASVLLGEPLQRICAQCPLAEAHRPIIRIVTPLLRNDRCRGMLGVGFTDVPNVSGELHSLVGELAGDLAFALDNIDEERRRQAAEEQALQAASDYRSLADNVPALVTRHDSRLRFVYVNPVAACAGILAQEQYVGKTMTEAGIPGPDGAAWENRIRQVFDTGEPVEVEGKFSTPGGRRYFRVVVVPERAADGSVATALSLAQDVTDQRRNEELMVLRLRLFEFAATHTHHDILQRTLDEVEALTGSLVGFYHFVEPDQRTLTLQTWSTRTVHEFCTAKGTSAHYDIDQAGVWVDCVRQRRPVIHNDYASLPHRKGLPPGHATLVRELVVPIFRGDNIVAILGIGNKPTDYTEDDVKLVAYLADVAWEIAHRKQVEAERESLRANLAQADRLASMGMLAAGVAHEINNPLSYILYNLGSLADDMPKLGKICRRCHEVLSAQQGQYRVAETLGDTLGIFNPAMFEDMLDRLQEALSGTQRIKTITRSLGAFTRVEHVEVAPVDIQSCIEHAVTMSFNEIKYRARLVKDFSPVPAVLASDGKLAQVFLNLLINAAHATEEGHVEQNEVRVRTWSDGDSVFAEVSDTGKGIAPEHHAMVFDPFFTTKGSGMGSGLGLSICKSIVAEFGGDISFASELGKGTKFLIRLPRMPSAWEMAGDEKPVETAEQAKVRGRILVVDDEAGIRASIVRMLKIDHEVITAASGQEARLLLEKDKRFDVVFCDLMMPKMSGMELHAWLAGQDAALADQVVFITGGAFTAGASAYLAKVCNLRIEKPFDIIGFKKMTHEIVLAAKSKRGATSAAKRRGDL